MAHYRLFNITGGGSFCNSQTIVAQDDTAAIELSQQITPAGEAELWCEKRLVKRFQVRREQTLPPNSGDTPLFSGWSRR
jgi:hypothetical protein